MAHWSHLSDNMNQVGRIHNLDLAYLHRVYDFVEVCVFVNLRTADKLLNVLGEIIQRYTWTCQV